MQIDQLRAQYPGYSDDEIISGLKATKYQDYSLDEIRNAVGYKPPSDMARGFKSSFQQLPQLGYGLLAGAGAAGEAVAGEGGIFTGIKKAGVAGYTDWGKKIEQGSRESDSWSYSYDQAKEGNFGALIDWLQHGIGYAGGQGIQMLATAGIGSAVGKAALGTVAKDVAKGMVMKEAAAIGATEAGKALAKEELIRAATSNVAAKIGQTAALGAMSFGQEGGEIFGDLTKTAEEEGRQLSGAEFGKAFAATLAAGGLEFVGDKFGLDVMLGKSKVANAAMGSLASRAGTGGRVARAAVGGALAMPIEGGTEYFQTGIEEYGKGAESAVLPWNQSERAQSSAIDSAALGALGGTVMGGAGGLMSRAQELNTPPMDAPAAPTDDGKEAARKLGEATNVGDMAAAATELAMAPLTPQRADAAMSAFEQRAADDQADIKQQGRMDRTGLPPLPQREQDPARQPSATVIDSPFGDRVLTLREQIADPQVRQTIRDQFGDEALGTVAYYATIADDVTKPMPDKTRDRLLGLAEGIVSKALLRPLNRPGVEGTTPAPAGRVGMAPRAARIGLDTGQTGRFRVDAAGNAAPETNADVIDSRQRTATRPDGFEQQVQGRPLPRDFTMVGEGDLTTPQRRERAPQPTLLLTQDNQPYGSLSAATVRARKEGGEVVAMQQGGWAVRKETAGDNEPDVAVPAQPVAATGDRRDSVDPRSGRVDGPVPDGAGGVGGTSAAPSASGGPAAAVADGRGADGSLSTLKSQWAEAVRAGDTEGAARINEQIVAAKAGKVDTSAGRAQETPKTEQVAAPAPATVVTPAAAQGTPDAGAALSNARKELRSAMSKVDAVNAEWESLYGYALPYFSGDGPGRKLSANAPDDIKARYAAFKAAKKDAQRAYDEASAKVMAATPAAMPAPATAPVETPAPAAPTAKPRQLNGSDTEKARALFTPPAAPEPLKARVERTRKKPAAEAAPAAPPAPVSSVDGQKNLAYRGSRIAVLKQMNDRLRRIAPGDAWADSNIEDATDLDALQDQISAALVAAERGPVAVNPLRAELEAMSGAELRAIMERMNLAGARMVQEERIAALLAEDPAEVRAAMQEPVATHKDPGEPAEPATPAVVAEAIKTAARNEDRPRSEMRAEALRLIDAAMADAKDENDTDVRAYEERSRAKVDKKALDRRGLTGVLREKAQQEIERRIQDDVNKAAENIGYVTIKVPGDGEFKVLNTKERLAEFRKKVEASPGFKDRQAPTASARTGMYEVPFGVERGSGGNLAAFSNMVDDGDMDAALDYAEAAGIDPKTAKLTDVLRKRLDKFMRDKEMGAAVAEREQAAPAPEDDLDPTPPGPKPLKDRVEATRKPAAEPEAPALDLKGFDRTPKGNGAFELRDGNLLVRVEPTERGMFQAFQGSTVRSGPRMTEQQAIDWAAAAREESLRVQKKDAASLKERVEAAKKPAAPIEDFGQKLEGARKDYAGLLKDAEAVDISAEPLSKSWPEPDYQKMLDGGADPFVVAFIRSARDEIPTKPQKAWKLKGWVDGVKSMRETARSLLAGEVSPAKAREIAAKTGPAMRAVLSRAELYELVGHDKSLKGITFAKNHYTLYRGQENVTKWVVEQKAKATMFSNWPRELAVADTKEDMLAQFKAKLATLDTGAKAKGQAQFVIYRKRGQTGAFVGKKIGREYIDLHKAEDVAAARKYMQDNAADLEKALEAYKQTPFERKTENQPRVGDDHRNGAPVTPEIFAETFGFRGVQFGNYVEQGRRQSDLNQAFDGLMDMAAVLGIPPRAISLNGKLGLAFGARGKGGNNAPAAHYEPGNVVINLTKGSGPGSLAHEWWHSLDNYFGKESGTGGYGTGGTLGDQTRAEMKAAFDAVKKATQVKTLRQRAAELDKRKSKPYWDTPIELSARSFEMYVIAKLQDQGAANDYLANVVSKEFWDAQEAMRAGLLTETKPSPTFPYPIGDEMPAVRASFDDFFKTVETRTDDAGNVAMFSRTIQDPTGEQDGSSQEFWQRLRDGDFRRGLVASAVPGEVLARFARRRGQALDPSNAAADGREDIRFADELAGYKQFVSYAVRISDGETTGLRLHVVPIELVEQAAARGDDVNNYKWRTDASILTIGLVGSREAGYSVEVDSSAPGKLAYDNAAPGSFERTGQFDPRGVEYHRLRVGQRVIQDYLSEAVRRFGLSYGFAPDLNITRDTGANPTTEARRIDAAKVEARMSRRAGRGVPMPDAEGVAENIRRALPDAPPIIMHDTVRKAPAGLLKEIRAKGAENDVEAVYWNGEIHVFPGNIASPERMAFVVGRHEIRHHGIRTMFPSEKERNALLLRMSMDNAGLQEAAQDKLDAKLVDNRVDAVEEALADMPVEQLAKLKGFDRLVATIRNWLRGMAERLRKMDMPTLAAAIEPSQWTDNDVAAFVLKAEAVSRGGAPDGSMFSRRGWSNDFPDAVLGHRPGVVNAHPDYAAAKAGDDVAALRLARDLVTDEYAQAVRDAMPDGATPVIVPVLALEAAGKNRIPLMAAQVLADRLGLQVDEQIVQAQRVGRGGSDGMHRIATQPTFSGPVTRGADYLILDDTLTQGGTLAQLKTHIEDNGGRVILASALTGKQYSAKIALSNERLTQLRDRFGAIESWWRSEFGYGFDGFTESEARFILELRGNPSADAIRDRVDAARVRSIGGMGAGNAQDGQGQRPVDDGGGAMFSRSPAATITTAQDLVDTKGGVFDFNRMGESGQDRLRTVMDGSRPFWLGALTRDQIADVYGKEIPPVKEYDELTRGMENQRSKMAGDADELYSEWAKLDQQDNDRLARIMLDGTVHQVHPDRPFAPIVGMDNAERLRVHGLISTQYKLLPAEAKAMYGKVRDFHLDTLTKLRNALEARIERQVENGNAKAAALTSIRKMFDKYLGSGPYFPLSRFGDYLVVANREADGERVVASYATAGEQQTAARKLAADGFTVKMKTAKTYSRETDGAAGKFIGEVLSAVDSLDMQDGSLGGNTADLKNKLLDDINQMFIKALPDLSYRKHFMHRKGTPGFSSDVMRGFASSAFHAASHIARLNYGDRMTFALQDAFTSIENAPDGDFNLHSQVLNELTKRHDAAMNPNTHPIAAMLNQVGFVMYLGLSPAAGLVNMLQTVMVTMPHLGARYGFGKANSSLAKALTDITSGARANAKNGWNAAQSTKLTAAERAVMSELQDEGVIDLTQAHDLASATGLDTGNVARSKAAFAMSRAMKIVGWTFHIPEVMNRQVTALSAYRLEMAKSGDVNAAKDAAREAIKRTHFDYSASNRARFMSGNLARVVTQFKQYSQNMTYLLARAAHQALKGESPEVRAIARKQLVATLGVTFAMAGAMGLPGLGGAMGLLGMMAGALDDDDKPWDWKTEFRNLLADTVGQEAGEVIAHGIPRALMPWDISNRVGLGEMWWRSNDREGQNPREAFANDMQNILGPTAGTLLGLYTAADHMARGNWSKATESVVPKFLRDPLKAMREAQDGMTNYNGEPLLDVDAAEVAGRLLGFAPARGSEMFEARNAIKNAETVLNEKRQNLLSRMVKARMDLDTAEIADLQSEIQAFNQRNPEFRITMDSILKSMRARRRNMAETEDGVRLPRGKEGLRELGRFAEAT